jgi:hypothetical protein
MPSRTSIAEPEVDASNQVGEPRRRKIGPIDLSKVTAGFPLLADGRYLAVLEKWDASVREQGKNAGADSLNMTWIINGEVHPEVTGRKIFDTIDIVDTQTWRLRSLCDALELDEEEIAAFDAEAVLDRIINEGDEVVVEVGHYVSKSNGKTYNQVNRYYSPNEEDPTGPSGMTGPTGSATTGTSGLPF